MELTSENVAKIFKDCLFKETEIIGGKPTSEPMKAEGIISNFGFHSNRLETYRTEIKDLLSQLPKQFKKSTGGGWSFLQACMTENGCQWGEHRNMEQLFALGIALKLASYVTPRNMWKMFPGGMPYIVVED